MCVVWLNVETGLLQEVMEESQSYSTSFPGYFYMNALVVCCSLGKITPAELYFTYNSASSTCARRTDQFRLLSTFLTVLHNRQFLLCYIDCFCCFFQLKDDRPIGAVSVYLEIYCTYYVSLLQNEHRGSQLICHCIV